MTGIETAVAAGATVYVAKDLVLKLLGPTAEYLGNELQGWVAKRKENVETVLARAVEKLGSRLEEPGGVPAKVLQRVIEEASFAEDEVAREYMAGILAGSRSETRRDDRGAQLVRRVGDLSTYQLRSHYLVYATISQLRNMPASVVTQEGRLEIELLLPTTEYTAKMKWTEQEWNNQQLAAHIWEGLRAGGLIEDAWFCRNQEEIQHKFGAGMVNGIVCRPTALGAELFLWSQGWSNSSLEKLWEIGAEGLLEKGGEVVEGTRVRKVWTDEAGVNQRWWSYWM